MKTMYRIILCLFLFSVCLPALAENPERIEERRALDVLKTVQGGDPDALMTVMPDRSGKIMRREGGQELGTSGSGR